jgi:stearoyl-CoA desaturase (delta-9 desaturase)
MSNRLMTALTLLGAGLLLFGCYLITPMLAVSVGTAMVLLQASAYLTTIYLHRGVTHKSIQFPPWLVPILRIALNTFTMIYDMVYRAVHLAHHADPDAEGDPHSPYLEGRLKVLFGNLIYYRRAAKNKELVERYSRDFKRSRLDKVLVHTWIFPTIGTVALCYLMGIGWALLAITLHSGGYIFLSGAINSLGHDKTLGYANYDNTARNIRFLALITAGEGLHNNHHGAASDPKFSRRPDEFDPAWPIIRFAEKLGLAHPNLTVEERHAL